MMPLIILLLVGAFIVDSALINMISLWVGTDTYMHGALVIPLCYMLIKQLPLPKNFSQPSILNIIIVATLWLISLYVSKISLFNVLQQIAFLTGAAVITYSIFGFKGVIHYKTPLALLFLCIPFGDSFVPHLQSVTADLAVYFLRLSDVSVYRQGWYLSIPNADFRVAEACSGVNFLISTFVLGVFFSFMEFNSILKRVFFVSLAIIIPIVANGVRVYLIIMIADMGYVDAATGFDHLVYGWVFFLFVLGVLGVIGWYWRDEIKPTKDEGKELEVKNFTVSVKSRKPILILCLASLGFTLFQIREIDLSHMPISVESKLGAHFPGASRHDVKTLENNLEKHTIYFNRENDEVKLLSINNRLFSTADWTIDSTKKIKISNGNALETKLKNLHGETKFLYSTYFSGRDFHATKSDSFVPLWLNRLKNPSFERGAILVLSDSQKESKEIDALFYK